MIDHGMDNFKHRVRRNYWVKEMMAFVNKKYYRWAELTYACKDMVTYQHTDS